MNQQFIQGISIDWKKIDEDSYLRKIGAIRDIDTLMFEKPIIFLSGKMAAESRHC